MMEHSLIFGHFKCLASFRRMYPLDINVGQLSIWMVENWETLFPGQASCPAVAYLDVWPMMDPVIFVLHPKVSAQFTQARSLPKGALEHDYVRPLTDNLDILSADGDVWKKWRSRFNPGFSSRSITALVPAIMEDMLVFLDVLGSHAGKNGQPGEVVQLERLTTNLTFDIIMKAMM
jgi:cytochrome P450